MSGDCSGASCSGTYFYSFVSRFAGVGKGSRTLFTVLDLHLVFYRSFALKLFVFVVFGCARPGVDELFRLFLALSPGFFETTYGINEISYCVLMLWPALGYWFGSFLIKHSACPTKLAHTSIIASGLVALIVILIGVVAPSIPLWAVIAILCMQFIGVGAAIPYSQNGQVSLPLALPGVSTGLFSLFK